ARATPHLLHLSSECCPCRRSGPAPRGEEDVTPAAAPVGAHARRQQRDRGAWGRPPSLARSRPPSVRRLMMLGRRAHGRWETPSNAAMRPVTFADTIGPAALAQGAAAGG